MEVKVPPIVVAGMHRSGTSLVSSILQELGVFMGNNRDENEESFFFLKVNHWILKQYGASWDYPEPYKFEREDVNELIIPVLEKQIRTLYSKYSYFGISGLISHSFDSFSGYWGWKDPRNTYTIPLWKKVFPSMRVIGIYRNPIDVCKSMVKRENQKLVGQKQEKFDGDLKSYFYKGTFLRFSSRFLDIQPCYEIWRQYNQQLHSERVGANMMIKYEDLLANPKHYIESIAKEVGIKSEEKVNAACKLIDSSRAYSFDSDEIDNINFFNSIVGDPIIQQLGYENLI